MNSVASNGKSNGNKPGGITGKGFVKGKSGNPRGRVSAEDDMKAIIRAFAAERDRAARNSRLRVMLLNLYKNKPEIILYLGWGKPSETHTITVREEIAGVPQDVVEKLRGVARMTVNNGN
jgi:hypothetical protein